MTMGDWAKFVSAHLRGDPKNPTRESILLKAETYETLHRPIDNYAMGWQVIPHPVPPGMKFFDYPVTCTKARFSRTTEATPDGSPMSGSSRSSTSRY